MKEIKVIGLDLAKQVFQVHGVNTAGETVLRRTLKRGQVRRFFAQLPPCLVGIEACGGVGHGGHRVGLSAAQRRLNQQVRRRRTADFAGMTSTHNEIA